MNWGWTNLLEIITKSIYDKLITQFPKRERQNSFLLRFWISLLGLWWHSIRHFHINFLFQKLRSLSINKDQIKLYLKTKCLRWKLIL